MTTIENALQLIQFELKAPKSKDNDFGKYKYRNCEDILEAVKPLLKKHNASLVITDEVKEIGSIIVVTAKVIFTDASGKETVVTAHAGVEVNKKGMDIAQTFGASSSYARKYALNGLFLIDDTKDYDSNEYHNQINGNSKSNQGNPHGQSAQANSRHLQGQQQKPIEQRYQDALKSIAAAKKPETLDRAINTFGSTKYAESIQRACDARADQMGWSTPPPNQYQNHNPNQLHH